MKKNLVFCWNWPLLDSVPNFRDAVFVSWKPEVTARLLNSGLTVESLSFSEVQRRNDTINSFSMGLVREEQNSRVPNGYINFQLQVLQKEVQIEIDLIAKKYEKAQWWTPEYPRGYKFSISNFNDGHADLHHAIWAKEIAGLSSNSVATGRIFKYRPDLWIAENQYRHGFPQSSPIRHQIKSNRRNSIQYLVLGHLSSLRWTKPILPGHKTLYVDIYEFSRLAFGSSEGLSITWQQLEKTDLVSMVKSHNEELVASSPRLLVDLTDLPWHTLVTNAQHHPFVRVLVDSADTEGRRVVLVSEGAYPQEKSNDRQEATDVISVYPCESAIRLVANKAQGDFVQEVVTCSNTVIVGFLGSRKSTNKEVVTVVLEALASFLRTLIAAASGRGFVIVEASPSYGLANSFYLHELKKVCNLVKDSAFIPLLIFRGGSDLRGQVRKFTAGWFFPGWLPWRVARGLSSGLVTTFSSILFESMPGSFNIAIWNYAGYSFKWMTEIRRNNQDNVVILEQGATPIGWLVSRDLGRSRFASFSNTDSKPTRSSLRIARDAILASIHWQYRHTWVAVARSCKPRPSSSITSGGITSDTKSERTSERQ